MTITTKKIMGMVLCMGLSSTLTSTVLASSPSDTRALAAAVRAVGFNFAVGNYVPSYSGVVFGTNYYANSYLVAAPSDESAQAVWAADATTSVPDAVSNGIFAGIGNTTAIVSAFPSDTTNAAAVCAAKTSGGYTDWYLPSAAELTLLGQNQVAVTAAAVANGGGYFANLGAAPSTDATYWASTQMTASQAWYFDFSTNTATAASKSVSRRVRCIRKQAMPANTACWSPGSTCN